MCVVRIVITMKKTSSLHPVIRHITVPSLQLVLEVHYSQVSLAPPTQKTWVNDSFLAMVLQVSLKTAFYTIYIPQNIKI